MVRGSAQLAYAGRGGYLPRWRDYGRDNNFRRRAVENLYGNRPGIFEDYREWRLAARRDLIGRHQRAARNGRPRVPNHNYRDPGFYARTVRR